jgi:O-antigen/teichoic acid export membrane protein
MSEKQLLKGAFLLTATGLFSKILSAGYRIPLQNMAGNEGFYIYQQIYPFIMVAWVFALYGFPAAISKVIAENRNSHEESKPITFHMPILLYLILINSVIFVLLYFGAEQIAYWMGDIYLIGPIKTTSFIFLFVPFTSFLRGSFQSKNEMRPTAVSQTVEQVVRVGFILFFTYQFLYQGRSLYEVGNGAAFASSIAALFGIIVLLFYCIFQRKQIQISKSTVSVRKIGRAIIASSLIVGLNYLILVLIQLVDNFTMVEGLQEYGLTLDAAKIEKGIFDRGQPLVQLGIVFGSSVSLALFPAIHNVKRGLRQGNIEQSINRVLKLTIIISAAATLGLMLILPSLNIALFETRSGTEAIQIFSLMILLISITLTLSTYLQSFGFIKRQSIIFAITLGVKWLLNEWLIPILGMKGTAISSVISGVFLVVAFGIILKRHSNIRYLTIIPWRAMFFALVAMSIVVNVIHFGHATFLSFENRMDHFIVAIVSVFAGAVTFLSLIIKLRGFTKFEIEQLPIGKKIIRFLNL